MAEKWQLWMPFYVDRFRGSSAVQAMHPTARAGYLYLLASQWQSEDCTIPPDPLELAEISGLGDELWALHGPRILRKFEVSENGHLRNIACFEEWKEAKRVFDARRQAAQNTNNSRSPHGHRTVTARRPSRSADTGTGTQTRTGTYTGTVVQSPPTPPEGGALSAGANGEFMLATWLGEELGLAWSRSDIPLIANVIRLEAKSRGEPPENAADFLRTCALAARKRGEQVTVWWFKDRKFAAERKNGNGKQDYLIAIINGEDDDSESIGANGFNEGSNASPGGNRQLH